MAKVSFATVLKSWFSANNGSSHQLARIASFIVTLVGCLVFMGWSLNIPILISPILGAATMKTNTALCFILAGISLGLQTRNRQNRRTVRIAKGCAIAISAIALLTLCQYLFRWNLGIDQLLVRDLFTSDLSYPGRMGDNTALNFALTGLALWLRGKRTRRIDSVAQTATLCATAIALLAVVGHAYNVQVFHRFIFYSTSMSFNTALTFLVLCGGILASRTDYGLWKIFTGGLAGSSVVRRLIPIAIILPFCLGWLILHGLNLKLYDIAFCLALLVVSLIFTFTIYILWNAQSLNQVDYDRRRSSDRLRSSEERYRRLAANIPGVIYQYVTHPDGTHEFLYVSPKSTELYEATPEELQEGYDFMWQRLHPEDAEKVHAASLSAAQQLCLFDLEFRLLMPSGQIKWIQATSHPIKQENGDVVFDGLITDISDRKQAQLNEQFLNDLDFRLRQLSDANAMEWEAVSSLGEYLKVDRVLWSKVNLQEDIAIVEQDWRRQADISTVVGEYRLSEFLLPALIDRYRAGQPVVIPDVTTHAYTAPFASNFAPWNIRAFVGIPCLYAGNWVAILAMNATTPQTWQPNQVALLQETVARLWSLIQQTQAVQALREQEERTRLATEAVELGMWFWDLSKDELVWTDRCKDLFGLPLETQMSYEVFLNALHPEDRDRTHAAVTHAIDRHAEYDIEYRSLWPDGSIHWVAAKGRAFYDVSGQPMRMMGTAQDISNRKQAESALEKRNQELDSFVHIVSHDLKAPLRGIANLSQWIEEDAEGALSVEMQQQMTLLRSRVYRMQAMIDGLLDYARIGRTDSMIEPTAVEDLLSEVIDSLNPPPSFSIMIAPDLPTFNTKRLLLSQVFANLIGNSIKHHDRPDGSIRISGQDRGNFYEFAIADDGPGIAPEYQDKIFTIFQSGESKNRQDSTGIGLSIVQKIVESEKGMIWLESELGKGTTFYVTWPK
jgi:PAS domain S-box-containing protein